MASDSGSQPLAQGDGNSQRNPLDPLNESNCKTVPAFANESKQHETLHARMMKQQQNGEQVGNYVSPSDNILSPASAKLNAFKEKRFPKSTKPRSLFNKTDSSTTFDSREHLQADAGSKGDAK
ncbi:MAG: hypothetical protein M1828_001761 [Chrysothrix sp. TS-e1954]|nr:MAG: hypothetical protein M1828_001761 [Chrysothrix sp. TS-e1954]